jgi:hypothetical protein
MKSVLVIFALSLSLLGLITESVVAQEKQRKSEAACDFGFERCVKRLQALGARQGDALNKICTERCAAKGKSK